MIYLRAEDLNRALPTHPIAPVITMTAANGLLTVRNGHASTRIPINPVNGSGTWVIPADFIAAFRRHQYTGPITLTVDAATSTMTITGTTQRGHHTSVSTTATMTEGGEVIGEV